MKERKQISEQFKWDLTPIFANENEWENEFATLMPESIKLSKFKGLLNEDSKLLEFLTKQTQEELKFSRLYVWAHLNKDTDTRDSKFQALADRIEMEGVKMSSLFSFVMPELSAFSDEKLKGLIEDSRFENFSVYFAEILRSKKLVLSEKEEKILAEVGSFAGNSKTIFSMFDNADIKFQDVENEKGKKIEMSHGVYSMLLQNTSQKVRENAFNSMFNAYKEHINTLTAIYAGNVKKDWFYAKIRGFESCMASSMYHENVKPVAYEKLIEATSMGIKAMHEYIALRKKVLGVETLNMYDLYVPLIEETSMAMTYEKAKETVKCALKPLGEDYQELLDKSFNEGWIDVFETKGKRSGAYSWGTYGVHPYVLLNYQKTTHDVFTLAHELGHAMHSYFSNEAQCAEKADYEIFVAEIASTVNEVLLLKYMLANSSGKMKQYLLSYYLDMFRTTLFRQTMFAEFESMAHNMVEKDIPLTSENLCNTYLELNKKYYGKSVKHNDLIKYEWARIPHFYTAFYVYKYATGITAAVSIANKILKEGKPAVDDYKKFLSAGGSMPPLDILRLAGVDLETDLPYQIAMNEFKNAVKELKKEILK